MVNFELFSLSKIFLKTSFNMWDTVSMFFLKSHTSRDNPSKPVPHVHESL